LRGNGRNILVDAGIGEKYTDKFKGIYKIDFSRFSLERSFADAGLKAEDITDVIITHLHFDHAGGCTKLLDGKLVPTFPNAKYYVQRTQLELAKNPSERDEGSFFADDFEPLERAGQLVVLSGLKEIAEGVSIHVTNGHTDGQQNVIVTDGSQTLFHCADMIPTSAHLGLPWIMGYDLRPLVTLEEKKFILNKAKKECWTLFFEHCPEHAFMKIAGNSQL
jgi:glyoxylase-like metal-dependent hydrolase (beta-lactamase superfamily II)